MKKYCLLLLSLLIVTSCGGEEKDTIENTPETAAKQNQEIVNNDTPAEKTIVASNMACIQNATVSEPGLDTYSSKTCMSSNTLSETMFQTLCEAGTQLPGIELSVSYVKSCEKPYHGICKNAAPEQSIQVMGGSWDIYYYDQKDVVKDSSGNPYCKDFEKGAL
ncbi:hypothetical protein OAN96_01535 [Candidatus Gracilibacteria bacterium]|nr:hypothetical protein [Candidatus Gracilibacteria bacterium]